jgi:hypothetical protein
VTVRKLPLTPDATHPSGTQTRDLELLQSIPNVSELPRPLAVADRASSKSHARGFDVLLSNVGSRLEDTKIAKVDRIGDRLSIVS